MALNTPDSPPLAHAELRASIAAKGEQPSTAAKRLGCTHSYLVRVLRGEHVPTDPFRHKAERLYGVPAFRWDPRSLDRDVLIRGGFRPGSLARRLGLAPSIVLLWWRGGHQADVAAAVLPLLEQLAVDA